MLFKDYSPDDINIFDFSPQVRNLILSHVRIKTILKYKGKAFVCVLINSRCHIGCEHCMFKASMRDGKNINNTLTERGVALMLKLIKDSNAGYFLVSSAGESFLEKKLINKILREASVDVLWLVTSGYWASERLKGERILKQLFDSFLLGQKNNKNRIVFLRISIDKYHIEKIGKNLENKFQYIIQCRLVKL